MMMNNRLNKLTDSLSSQLNYRSRHPGKPTKHKKHKGSPLLVEQPKSPVLITSRISSRPSTPCFNSQDNSILWQDEQQEEDSGDILIVDPPLSPEILIDEGEPQLQEKIEQKLQRPSVRSQQRMEESSPPNQRQEKSSNSSPIFIMQEDDEDLLWIKNEDELPRESNHSSPSKNQIKIVEDDEEEEESWFDRQSHLRVGLLSQIQEISSFEEDDNDPSQNILATSRIPISPQTIAPFLNLKRVQQEINQLSEQYWITQEHIDNNTISYLSPEASPERIQLESPQSLGSRYNGKHLHNCIDRNAIKDALSSRPLRPFDLSLKKTKQLKEDILPKKLHSLYEMKFLIQNQSNFVKERLQEQRGTISILKKIVALKVQVPEKWNLMEYSTISQEQQILINQMLIRIVVRGLKQ